MNRFTAVINTLIKKLRIDDFNMGEAGVVRLRIADKQTYALEEIAEEVLIQLLLPVSLFEAAQIKKKLILLADYRRVKRAQIFVLRHSKEKLILQIRVAIEDFSVNTIEQSMEYLAHCAEYALGQRETI
jgi:hypothetical protein